MLSIDEAIAHAREVASRQFDDRVHCIRCAEEHEQLAKWLEELKAYKEIGTVEECKNNTLEILKAYNKAIDSFVENISLKISDSFIWGKIANCFKSKNIDDISDEIIVYIINTTNEIAEQLKEKI